MPEPQIMKKIF